ncbi:Fic family protein [Nocardioides sp.]|uniref:Fic family protein n=1 Tax=Nocardioides sp. TaxID=35761 RepID=UPI002624F981|nr:Fic family protein [Nocardioides sp.]
MKTPMPPPDVTALRVAMMQEDADRFLHVLDLVLHGSALTTRYLPWDKVRYKQPPGDLSHEEWWLGIKFGRRGAQRDLPALRAIDGTAFSYLLPDEVLAGVDAITRNASGAITISEEVTNPATRDRYIVSSLIEEAITSSQLEGAATSRRVAKDMIRNGRTPRDRSERMIFNNYVAMRRVTELRDEAMTPDLVCEIHRIVTDGTLDTPESAGRIQDDDADRIAVWGDGDQLLHRPPVVAELPDRLERLCAFANGEGDEAYLSPVLRAIAVHFMMGYDHYFEDGNGRTARALFYWTMLRNGYWLTEFLAISRILKQAPSKYAQSFLLAEQDDGDLTHFFIYHLNVITRAIDELHGYLAVKAEELRGLQRAIKATPGEFNHRQLAVLEHATRHPDAVYTVDSHARSHHASGQTARNDLADLEKRGLLRRSKQGRRFAWVPAVDLADRLVRDRLTGDRAVAPEAQTPPK